MTEGRPGGRSASITADRLPAKPRTASPIAASPGRENGNGFTLPIFMIA
jgi:hypothetical protein